MCTVQEGVTAVLGSRASARHAAGTARLGVQDGCRGLKAPGLEGKSWLLCQLVDADARCKSFHLIAEAARPAPGFFTAFSLAPFTHGVRLLPPCLPQVNGVSVRDLRRDSLRSAVAVVPQVSGGPAH